MKTEWHPLGRRWFVRLGRCRIMLQILWREDERVLDERLMDRDTAMEDALLVDRMAARSREESDG